VVVTSKTFKQLTRLAGAAPQRKGPFVTRRLTRSQIRSWIPRLAALPPEERARLRGVSASRAHQILAGAVIANTTLKALNVEEVDLCPWALREGIILRHLEQIANDTELPLQPVVPGRTDEATVTALRP
jgi:exopolyphosphatase/guanosine-5'-triphosphate,3'-diphosphate pyrophosphatase